MVGGGMPKQLTGIRCKWTTLGLWLAWTGIGASASAQPLKSLEQVEARLGEAAEFAPANAGMSAVVRGVVNSAPFWFPTYTLVSFDDGQFGAILKQSTQRAMLAPLIPGDEIDVEGTVEAFHGMPVIVPASVV